MLMNPVRNRTIEAVRQLFCALHGHDSLLHFRQARLSLVCTSCGYETPGWELNGVPPRTDAPLFDQRRVA